MQTIKPTQVRVYLNPEQAETAATSAAMLEVEQSWIINKIVAEGLRAIRDNGNRFELPLRFHLEDEAMPPIRAPLPKSKGV